MTCSLGNPNVECVRIPSTCFSSTDCPASMQCADGICMPGCQSDENCAVNERCLQGLCMREYQRKLFADESEHIGNIKLKVAVE